MELTERSGKASLISRYVGEIQLRFQPDGAEEPLETVKKPVLATVLDTEVEVPDVPLPKNPPAETVGHAGALDEAEAACATAGLLAGALASAELDITEATAEEGVAV